MYYAADTTGKGRKGMRKVKTAAIQMQCSTELQENLEKAEKKIREAAAEGANIILLPELFEREYFCQQRRYDFYHYAKPAEENEAVQMGVRLAKELGVVLPISFYEKEVNNLYNSIACIDADGTILGIYRKHIFRMTTIIRKNFILRRAILDFASLRPDMERSASESAGISGFQRVPDAWHFRVQNFCFIRLLSVRSQFWNVTACRTGGVVCRAMRQPI